METIVLYYLALLGLAYVIPRVGFKVIGAIAKFLRGN